MEDAIKLYKFYRECDGFEVWAKQTVMITVCDSQVRWVYYKFFFISQEKKLVEPPNSDQIDVARRKFDVLVKINTDDLEENLRSEK